MLETLGSGGVCVMFEVKICDGGGVGFAFALETLFSGALGLVFTLLVPGIGRARFMLVL